MQHAKVLIIGLHWPEPRATAAGQRMMELIHCLKEFGADITFASAAKKTALSAKLGGLQIATQQIRLNHDSFDHFVQELLPDIVIFDRFMTEEQYGWRVARHAPESLRILDTEDLHSLRITRQEAVEKGRDFELKAWMQHDLTKREIASIFRCDLSLIISDYEMQLLQNVLKVKASLLFYLPFLAKTVDHETTGAWLPFDARKDFIFIGTGKHKPNIDAIYWLNREIWPAIRKELPQANLHVYGSYLPGQISNLHHPAQGFLVHGWIADGNLPMSQARVNLAPLRYGAGIKGKLLHAMSQGTPSARTPVAEEGFKPHAHVYDLPDYNTNNFATQAISLYTNKEDWYSAQLAGITTINEKFDKKKFGPGFKSRLTDLLQTREDHRSQNFIGSMLMHHSMTSTEYMAKWIAAKNLTQEASQD